MVGIICVVSRFRQIIFAISEDLASAANVKIMSAFKFTSMEQVTNPNKIVTQDHSRFSQKAILDASSNSANKYTLKFSWTPFRKTLQNVQDCPNWKAGKHDLWHISEVLSSRNITYFSHSKLWTNFHKIFSRQQTRSNIINTSKNHILLNMKL